MVSTWIVAVVAALISVVAIFVRHYKNHKASGIPGPLGLPYFGSVFSAMLNSARLYAFFLDMAQKHGPVFNMWTVNKRTVFILDPEVCHYVLARNFKNYIKGARRHKEFEELLGNGIFVTNGDEWKFHRRLARPLFRKDSVAGMVPLFVSHATFLFDTIDADIASKKPTEVCKMFMQYTMDTFLELGLGSGNMLTREERMSFAAAFDYCQKEIDVRGLNPLWEYMVPKKFNDSIAYINKLVYGVIKSRLAERENPELLKTKTDIFSQFLLATDDDGQPLSEVYLRDVFMNFLLAGRDTTAALLTWTLYNMTRYPELANKVKKEIDTHVATDTPTAEEILQLTYTKQFMTEVLRLYPSVPFDGREAAEDDVLPNGMHITKGSDMIYSPWCMGRMPQVFEDPERFDPDRWTEERVKAMPLGTFTSFHLGPQTCLGKDMAYMEARVALAMLLKRYSFKLSEQCAVDGGGKLSHQHKDNKFYPSEPAQIVSIILVPENGMPITFSRS
eukprot:TRINITY_DN5421_c0_g1_i3.p1 TRINITY_DN5421_c0_g1~~TRINITY_DN5421_c0_g1_i3.p1  ORF type:complete len:503 (-),score=72.55 TRINITY_DN5421_c0_g1_i3:62-1570(-)